MEARITGSGVRSGGSLAGPAVSAGTGGGTVAVPSPCGIRLFGTQQEVEASFHGDKAELLLDIATRAMTLPTPVVGYNPPGGLTSTCRPGCG